VLLNEAEQTTDQRRSGFARQTQTVFLKLSHTFRR
jgi:hypothetical protein